jgi:methionyl-tRNA synthetase
VQPRSVYNEMMAILTEGLEDLSISRTSFDWGVPIPAHGGVIYVWLDALLNYITAIGWSEDETRFRQYWPASTQLVGKEIARFHTIIWPAILWALGETAPELVFAHGWITVEGQKMSKSLGNTVDPFTLAARFGPESMRYFLLREAPFGSDFSYSEEKIAQRHNSDLANDLGNLLQRTLSMVQRYRDGIVPQGRAGGVLSERFTPLHVVVRERILDLRFREALEAIWELVTALNQTIDERKPWVLHKESRNGELDAVLYDLCEGLRWIAALLHPVMPERSAEMWRQLGEPGPIDEDWSSSLARWGGLAAGTHTELGASLFPRIEAVTEPA